MSNSIQSIRRTLITASLLAAVAALLTGCGPRVSGPHTFQYAKQLEQQGRYTQSIQVYDAIVHDNSQGNQLLSAAALYEAGAYADDPVRYGKTESLRNDGQTIAWQHWKQLRDEFPTIGQWPYGMTAEDTQKWDRLRATNPGLPQQPDFLGKGFAKLLAVGNEMDRRNSSDIKYKIIDALVAATGRKPAFSYAFALIFLGVGVKLLLLPISMKQYKSQREMQQLMPAIKELQDKYKGTERSQKQMELYKEHGVNPFAGCLPMLLTLPFFFLIYAGVRLYEPAFYQGTFLWIGSSLSKQYPQIFAGNLALPDIPLLVMYTITNFVVMRMSPAPNPEQQQQQNSMAFMTSILFFFMFLNNRWSSAFVLYWLALNAFSIWQTYTYVYKPHRERTRDSVVNVTSTPEPTKNGTGGGSSKETVRDDGQQSKSPASKPGGAASQPARVRPRKKKR